MRRDIVTPPGLPEPRGFNHGILVSGGRLLFLAGQDASDGGGKIVAPGDMLGQMRQVLHNLSAVVHEAGGTMQDITQLTIYVTDRNAYLASLKAAGEVFRGYFGGYYPAMALFEVKGLFQAEALIEMQGIAVLGEE